MIIYLHDLQQNIDMILFDKYVMMYVKILMNNRHNIKFQKIFPLSLSFDIEKKDSHKNLLINQIDLKIFQ